jgi:23S rRNA pseudouridine1911/1915/1917 synthase
MGRLMESTTLLDWLARKYPLAKRQTLRRMVEAGRVRINGARAVRVKDPIGPEDRVEVSDRPACAAPEDQSARIPFGIVFEDDDILVVDKPAGLLTSTVPRERRPTLLAAVREYVKQQDRDARIGLIHRLDRDASGLLIFSKNDAAYRSLKTQFFHHSVVREYRAVVHGKPNPPADRIDTRLVERADGTVHFTREATRGERAISEYEVIKSERKLSLLRVKLETGRKHQIRVHLAGRGTPIVGDTVYGPKDAPAARLMLAATRLVIQQPRSGKRTEFTLPVPQEFPIPEA